MREYFPFFDKNKDVVYMDTAATSQTLYTVAEDLTDFLNNRKSNAHRSGNSMGTWVDQQYSLAKEAIAELVNVKSPDKTVVFTSGSSQALSDAVELMNKAMPGGTIFLGIDSHHSLLLPIQKLAESNPWWRIVYIGLDNTGKLDLDDLEQKVRLSADKVNLIAVSAVSNVLGKINDLNRIKQIAHANAANTIIDASQIVGKQPVDASGFDFVAWSWHKAYGATGLGTLIIDPVWLNYAPVRPGGGTVTSVNIAGSTWIDTAARFEAGTQNLAAICTIPRLVNWIKQHQSDISSHDRAIAKLANSHVAANQFIATSASDSGLLSLMPTIGTVEDYVLMLDARKIYVRGGKLCAQPLIDTITQNTALLRLSWGCYTIPSEIEKTFDTLGHIHARLQRNVR
jgi:cysteine desulfurase/selenocysteine lyase